MRPDPGKVLNGAAMAMLLDLPGDIRTPYGQAVAGMAGTLTLILSQEFDRMVDRLAVENESTAALLEQGRAFGDPGLVSSIDDALAQRVPADLRVATLQAVNDRLRGALIQVHVVLEGLHSDEARQLNDDIWAELDASTKRRAVELPGR